MEAFDHHNKRDGAAFGRAASCAVSLGVVLNRVDVVAINATCFACEYKWKYSRSNELSIGWMAFGD